MAHSLYRRAIGSETTAPDTTACIFWLKNRRREDWRDRVDVEKKIVREVTKMTDAELEDIARRAAVRAAGAGSANGASPPPNGSAVH